MGSFRVGYVDRSCLVGPAGDCAPDRFRRAEKVERRQKRKRARRLEEAEGRSGGRPSRLSLLPSFLLGCPVIVKGEQPLRYRQNTSTRESNMGFCLFFSFLSLDSRVTLTHGDKRRVLYEVREGDDQSLDPSVCLFLHGHLIK